jgi:hypothetical protein
MFDKIKSEIKNLNLNNEKEILNILDKNNNEIVKLVLDLVPLIEENKFNDKELECLKKSLKDTIYIHYEMKNNIE